MFAKNYAQYYDLFNQDKPYQKDIEFIYDWAEKPKWVLDIGCGTASYWDYYPLTTNLIGIEKSKEMFEQSHYPGHIVCADVRRFVCSLRHQFNCVTAIFDVINYIPRHGWWENLPLGKGGYFIFDIWDKEKVLAEGFTDTVKTVGGITRTIKVLNWSDKAVNLEIAVDIESNKFYELHKMFLHSQKDIERFCGKEFEIVEVKPTKRWQTWYKCKRK